MIGRSAGRAVAGSLLVAALSGCATIGTLAERQTRNKVFSGTIRHFELGCAHGVCLDFPFSLVADVVVLPVTIPWTVVNLLRAEEEPEGPGEKERPEEPRGAPRMAPPASEDAR